MSNPFDVLIDSYLDKQVGFDAGFLSKSLSSGLQQHLCQLHSDGQMSTASIGNKEEKDPHQQMRGDHIYWLDKNHDNIFEQEFLHRVDDFIAYLNQTCYTGINASEFHYAVYKEGAGYKRHLDQFRNDGNRKYSLINYLNMDWLEADGGHLLVYPDSGKQQILPQSQTAVFFNSAEMEHEVTVANRQRMSITGWLKQV
ncbi:2OG-Fe(II) oxygenase [Flavihumibacter fluvii]|uniref:2OG-Fe(II) oxygenase n=1 Tax=Flavihumibacter fluvii TaxID=2838157 RepID=UPI001BDEC875|nr:2OG-Fe(II) oxygenase [Flavihumibacter fluvii]ULQ52981.1 2OG-Fe(II) oxygenase [Flavihumibacter fluvii]